MVYLLSCPTLKPIQARMIVMLCGGDEGIQLTSDHLIVRGYTTSHRRLVGHLGCNQWSSQLVAGQSVNQ